jgi:hypothetical protein
MFATAALAVGVLAPPAHAASTGFELQQTLGKGDDLRLVVSTEGATAVETRGEDKSGVTVAYGSGNVFGLDYRTRTFTQSTTKQSLAEIKGERDLIAKMQIEPAKEEDGPHEANLEFPTFTALDLKDEIAGQPATAYELRHQAGDANVRVWFADKLPGAPVALQKQGARVLPNPLSSRRVMLRTEMRDGDRWVTGLDTIAIKPVKAPASKFVPPKGWKRVKPRPSPRAPKSIPALPLPLFGPVSHAPDVFALYWNGPFSATTRSSTNALLSAMVGGGAAPSPYWGSMLQYGVGRGRFTGSGTISYPMPVTVGSWNFFIVELMVMNSYFTTPAPKIWWRTGRDPLISIMVPSAAVAAGGWGGYHMVDISLQSLLPWPISLAAHPEMPWSITKSSPLTGAPDAATTTTLSHELVEMASDPLPLSANVDFSKSPPWSGGEIADICSVGAPLPVPTTVSRFGFTLAKYWARGSGFCFG